MTDQSKIANYAWLFCGYSEGGRGRVAEAHVLPKNTPLVEVWGLVRAGDIEHLTEVTRMDMTVDSVEGVSVWAGRAIDDLFEGVQNV